MFADHRGADAEEPALAAAPGPGVPDHRLRGVPAAGLRARAQAARRQLLQVQRLRRPLAGLHQPQGGQRPV